VGFRVQRKGVRVWGFGFSVRVSGVGLWGRIPVLVLDVVVPEKVRARIDCPALPAGSRVSQRERVSTRELAKVCKGRG